LSSVEGLNVIPNRERRENSVILSGAQYRSGVGVPLDRADCSPAEQFAAEYSAASSCEEREFSQAFTSALL
jgi:hypothetical protein